MHDEGAEGKILNCINIFIFIYLDEEYANYYENEDSDDQVADENDYDEHVPSGIDATESDYSNINMYVQQNKQPKFKY